MFGKDVLDFSIEEYVVIGIFGDGVAEHKKYVRDYSADTNFVVWTTDHENALILSKREADSMAESLSSNGRIVDVEVITSYNAGMMIDDYATWVI